MKDNERERRERKGKSYHKSPYPNTDSAEVTAIKVFEGLIDEKLVKTHITRRDKYPNTDGYVEPVDGHGRSAGKIHVQIKTMSDADLKRRGYSADEGFLGHCKDALEPSILVGVDSKNDRAYWSEVTRQQVERMEKQRTLTVRFSDHGLISEARQDYYKPWLDMLDRRKWAMALFHELGEDIDRARALNKLIEGQLRGIPIEEGVDADKIQSFLDEYNRLMIGEFAVLSRLFHPDARKFGFAYAHYTESHVVFAIYEIGKQSTNLDIMKISEDASQAIMSQGLESWHFYSENPIEKAPEAVARGLVREDCEKAIRGGGLDIPDEAVCSELIFDLLDKSHGKFGLDRSNSYSTTEVEYGLREFLPRWIANFLNICSQSELRGVLQTYEARQYFDIGFAGFGVGKDRTNMVTERTKEDLAKGTPVSIQISIGHRDFPIGLLPKSLDFLKSLGVEKVERPYPQYDYLRNPDSNLIFDWLSGASLLEKAKRVYEELPSAYDSVVKTNFPMLYEQIRYGHEYDRQVVILYAADSYEHPHMPRQIEFNLVCLGEDHDFRVEVFMSDDQQAPQLDFSFHDREISLDGTSYRLVSGCKSGVRKYFEPLPLYTSIIDRLSTEIKRLFDRWESETNTSIDP